MSSTLLALLRREARNTLRFAAMPEAMPVSDFYRASEILRQRNGYRAAQRARLASR